MKRLGSVLVIILLSVFYSCVEKEPEIETAKSVDTENFGLVIHGGAGTILKENMSDSLETAYKEKLEEAIRAGHDILEKRRHKYGSSYGRY